MRLLSRALFKPFDVSQMAFFVKILRGSLFLYILKVLYKKSKF